MHGNKFNRVISARYYAHRALEWRWRQNNTPQSVVTASEDSLLNTAIYSIKNNLSQGNSAST
ncbi:hypothetical protein DT73_22295 [Mangrovibacter sp. MFB070]|nr:hypothetical protein DT73_22295 [Mangrovibacter sp. MFB070]